MDINKEDFNGVYATIFECVGEEVTRNIHRVFGGQQFNFPKRLYSKEYVIRYLKENYNGKNVRKLAKELDYSERWVQAIINKNKIIVKGEEK
ncbi:Mor transcription activator family protein [Clostridium tertium]|uniref:Mor transcription activator family protein n=1 Tax=Clostridium tertium TaxID=1559 RepID=UPI002A807F3C|nr:Mor transcription activator family protein [Clostridium tertium]MDY3358955.1 Mor transcription activator family protein [Clostridium celatum]MDY4606012.1 Mor transcription activator family protein [Clostridium tertium]